MPATRTFLAVTQHLNAMGVLHFELGIRDGKHGKMILRPWTKDQVLQALPWLKYKNAAGWDIYFRPQHPTGWVLLDDLQPEQIPQLKQDGFAPAVVLQTSPGNLQAWIRLIRNNEGLHLPKSLMTAAARVLASTYHADPNSADWRHLGRLCGFTNQKPKHQKNGLFPYVLVLESSGCVASQGRHLLMAQLKKKSTRSIFPQADVPAEAPTYQAISSQIMGNASHPAWMNQPDLSRLDFMVVKILLGQGVTPSQIKNILLSGSPELETRKKNHVGNYVDRTIHQAIKTFLPPALTK